VRRARNTTIGRNAWDLVGRPEFGDGQAKKTTISPVPAQRDRADWDDEAVGR
jgi:hypothetical protein